MRHAYVKIVMIYIKTKTIICSMCDFMDTIGFSTGRYLDAT